MSKKKQPQNPKPRNEEWMRGRLVQANRNLTVPNKKQYKRPSPGKRVGDW